MYECGRGDIGGGAARLSGTPCTLRKWLVRPERKSDKRADDYSNSPSMSDKLIKTSRPRKK